MFNHSCMSVVSDFKVEFRLINGHPARKRNFLYSRTVYSINEQPYLSKRSMVNSTMSLVSTYLSYSYPGGQIIFYYHSYLQDDP